jgi:hypothetical protein
MSSFAEWQETEVVQGNTQEVDQDSDRAVDNLWELNTGKDAVYRE